MDGVKQIIESISYLSVMIFWLAGIVLSHGVVSLLAAIFFPPYAWYLVVERYMEIAGWIG